MQSLQCTRRAVHCIKSERWIQFRAPRFRQISSAQFPTRFSRIQTGGPAQRPLQNASWRRLAFQSTRLASTETGPYSSGVRTANPLGISNPSAPGASSVDRLSSPDQSQYGNITDSFDEHFITDTEKPIEIYSGYMKDLGLDYGWGPTAFMQTALEQVYMYTGLPWWASIIVTLTVVRAAVFKLYINGSDTSARMAAIKDITAPLDARAKEARILGDWDASRAASFEKITIYKTAGISTLTAVLPLLLQIPLGFGIFRLLRGMTTLPVPGLDTGGYLWFHDLLVHDPLFILPLIAAASLYKSLKLGGESGGASNMSESTMRTVSIVLPSVTFLFVSFWPAGLQLTITWGSVLAVSQAWLFKQVWFRDLLRMQRFPPKTAATGKPTEYKGTLNTGEQPRPEKKPWLSSFKDAYNDIVKQGQDLAGKRDRAARPGRSQAELKKAKAYEEKKTREAAQRRFEAEQAQQAAKEDQRLRKSVR